MTKVHTMDIELEVLFGDASGTIAIQVEYTYQPGQPATHMEPADGPEVELGIVWLSYPILKAAAIGYAIATEYLEVSNNLLPQGIYAAIETHICENHQPEEEPDL